MIGRSFLAYGCGAYGANVSNDSTKVLPTVPTFPTIARRSQWRSHSRNLLAYGAVSNDSSKVGMHTTQMDKSSCNVRYHFGDF